MDSFANLVAGRRSKFLVLAVWVLLVAALGPFAGRFEQAQRNEPSSFLPEGAESVALREAAAGFRSGEVTPAVATVVRSLRVPALTWELDERTGWPRAPRRRSRGSGGAPAGGRERRPRAGADRVTSVLDSP